MKWKILDTGAATAEENMAIDQKLLENTAESDQPLAHFYSWIGSCATYGYFTDPDDHLIAEQVQKEGLHIARRPTGGGIIFHTHDLAFSVIIPAGHRGYSSNTLKNYAFINEAVIEAVAAFAGKCITPSLHSDCSVNCDTLAQRFCMAKPTKYDVMIEGKKVGGAAQRRTKSGFLHQGTISLAMPPRSLLQAVLKDASTIIPAMEASSFCLLPETSTAKELEEARMELQKHLAQALKAK